MPPMAAKWGRPSSWESRGRRCTRRWHPWDSCRKIIHNVRNIETPYPLNVHGFWRREPSNVQFGRQFERTGGMVKASVIRNGMQYSDLARTGKALALV